MFNISKQQVLDAFHFRSACRSYDPNKKINKEDMDYILELGRLSPSSVGSEPWKFLVLQNRKPVRKIAPVSWELNTQWKK
ncbi:Putative NAD(P)H nitroreductase [Mannheimia haemolytica]|uniref:NAD(P)H nitroreductase n=1 Tax=Mannheimia haemolytica TaxID=75985 RepID=A0A378N6H3_MANHA|nr:Putative NAD(P)H nitroreductase [Mannheimia haemolytica]